ncbi:MAG TPA: tRNA (adenosine(37)-N6)-threonylcarbamoyltransferase complex transferase subunit TsaD [Ktedonobacterales bacterium]
MRVLAIESSCDETGAAVVDDGRIIRSNVVASQASIHERYGGVVPEVASRHQLSALIPVVESALREASTGWGDIDAIAATYGPGLAGSLLVGLSGAKALAFARGKPFLGVNHLEAHIYANWLRTGDVSAPTHAPEGSVAEWSGDPTFPLLALVVSGAHTELVHIPRHGHYELLGQTRDDAAGEAFDKVARLLGLGYPGGPAIQRAAEQRDTTMRNPYRLPRAWMRGTNDFSFSGLKTAVLDVMDGGRNPSAQRGSNRYGKVGASHASEGVSITDLADAFQDSVVDVLVTKTVRAAIELGVRQVALAGGVAANVPLRERLASALEKESIALRFPPIALCTDNAAMIGAAAYFHLVLGERSSLDLDVRPGLQLPFANAATVEGS